MPYRSTPPRLAQRIVARSGPPPSIGPKDKRGVSFSAGTLFLIRRGVRRRNGTAGQLARMRTAQRLTDFGCTPEAPSATARAPCFRRDDVSSWSAAPRQLTDRLHDGPAPRAPSRGRRPCRRLVPKSARAERTRVAGRRAADHATRPRTCRSARAGTRSAPPIRDHPGGHRRPGRPGRARPPSSRRSAWSSVRGVRGMIGHTQPRRIAARTRRRTHRRGARVPLGGAVGYAVRFTDQSARTRSSS